MNDFDKKLKEIAQNESWQVPNNIESKIITTVDKLDNGKNKKPGYLKIALVFIVLATIITASQTSAFEAIINYFRGNTQSAYISMREDIELLGKRIGKSSKDKDIELIVDSISIDGNFLNVFYTMKGNHGIKKYEDLDVLNYQSVFPVVFAKINNKDVPETHNLEYEYSVVSDTELRCMRRLNIALLDLEEDKIDLTIYSNEMYEKEGLWQVDISMLDISKGKKETLKYDVNKNAKIEFSPGNGVQIEHNINIEKVIISPFGSQIVITEKHVNGKPILGTNFALFDQNGKSLKVLDKGYNGIGYGDLTQVIEFLGADKNTNLLKLVPYTEDYEKEPQGVETKNIDELPVELKVSKYGSIIVEDVNISDKKIKVTYSTKGVVVNNDGFKFLDENGEEVDFTDVGLNDENKEKQTGSAFLYEPIYNRKTGKSSVTLEFYVGAENLDKIKKISTYENIIKVIEDQAVTINLK